MGDIISAFFSTPILFRALVVGILVSLCAALLGVSLVLKRYSMIGDGLSHVGFGALAIAAVINWAPMAVAVPVVIGGFPASEDLGKQQDKGGFRDSAYIHGRACDRRNGGFTVRNEQRP